MVITLKLILISINLILPRFYAEIAIINKSGFIVSQLSNKS